MMQTLIIGGGVSGLALAEALQSKGHDYMLVESRDRFGGRIMTQHHGLGYFDMGPAWFWPGQPRITAMIERLGLKQFDQHSDGILTFENEHGQVQRGHGFASMQGSWRLKGGLAELTGALPSACPLRIQTILTHSHRLQTNDCWAMDNGTEFTDRLFGLRKRAQSGKHEFDRLCSDLNIEHRLTPPMSPQTNGMVPLIAASGDCRAAERFNRRIEDVLQSHHFQSGEELEATLHRYAWLYNQQLPQSALGSKTPLQALKDWQNLKPERFKKQPYCRPKCDT